MLQLARCAYTALHSTLPPCQLASCTGGHATNLMVLMIMRRRVWGPNAPHRKHVFPVGSTRTKRTFLRVTPAVLLHLAGGT